MLPAEVLWGSVTVSLCTTAHPIYTRFASIFGASISEAAMRPHPKVLAVRPSPSGRLLARLLRLPTGAEGRGQRRHSTGMLRRHLLPRMEIPYTTRRRVRRNRSEGAG